MRWPTSLLNSGFKGKIYPVNPKGGKILGLQCYPSLAGIEDRIDFAILNLSPPFVPKALENCAAKKVKVVHIFSAGFAETGTDQGKKLQAEIRSIIHQTGIRTIEPNCMGVHSVEGGISFANLPRREGPSALVSQTGAGAARTILYGSRRGIYFGKAISYGNAVDLDSSDLVEMFADESKTDTL